MSHSTMRQNCLAFASVTSCLVVTLAGFIYLQHDHERAHWERTAMLATHHQRTIQRVFKEKVEDISTTLASMSVLIRAELPNLQRDVQPLVEQLMVDHPDAKVVGWSVPDAQGRQRLRQLEGGGSTEVIAPIDEFTMLSFTMACEPKLVVSKDEMRHLYLLQPLLHTDSDGCSGFVFAMLARSEMERSVLSISGMVESPWVTRLIPVDEARLETSDDQKSFTSQFTALGTTWRVVLDTALPPVGTRYRAAGYLLAAGLFVSLLFTLFVRETVRGNNRTGKEHRRVRHLLETRRALFDKAPAGIMLIGENGCIEDVNQAICSIVGYMPCELIGQEVELLVPDEFRILHQGIREKFIRRPQPSNCPMAVGKSLCVRKKGGESVHVEIALSRITTDSGVRVIAFLRDKTARHQYETELRRLALVAENTDNIVIITDVKGRVEWVNGAFTRTNGYLLKDIIGKRPCDVLFGPKSDPRTASAIEKAVKYLQPFHAEVIKYSREGKAYWVESDTQPVYHNGCVERFVTIERNVTERKRAEQDIRDNKSRLAEAQRIARIGSWERELSSSRMTCSEEFSRLLGISSEQLDGNMDLFYSRIHPDDLKRVRQVNAEAIRYHCPYIITYRIVVNGETRHVQEHFNARRAKDGTPLRHVGTIQDVTERVLLEQELRQVNEEQERRIEERTRDLDQARAHAESANHAKSTFVATMSHEIRTPLHAIIATAELLGCSNLASREAGMVARIRGASELLLNQISDILDFTKIEAGLLALEETEYRLLELLEAQLVGLYPRARQAGVRLDLDISPAEDFLLLGDSYRLQQILTNLIGNAVKFSAGRPQPCVCVSGRAVLQENGFAEVTIKVCDNGIGIDDNTLLRIWGPFTQAEDGTTRQYGGSGLGLAIVWQLVNLMQGRITVESTPNVGTTFTLCFTAPVIEATSATLPDLHGLCLLLLSPEGASAKVQSRWMRAAGAEVTTVVSESWPKLLDAAQPATEEPGYDLAVVDLEAFERRFNCVPDGAFFAAVAARASRILLATEYSAEMFAAKELVALLPPLVPAGLVRAVAIACDRETVLSKNAFSLAPMLVDDAAAEQAARLVLVVEDNPVNREVIAEQLAQLGCRAVTAADGLEALDRLQERCYSVLFTDLHMPRLDGFGLARAVREREIGIGQGHLAIIAMTADVNQGVLGQCLAAGIDDNLSKPMQLKALQATLERWLPDFNSVAQIPTFEAVARANKAGDSCLESGALSRMVGDDPALQRRLLGQFLEMAPAMVSEIHEAQDPTVASMAGHKLKSSAQAIGAHALADACLALEQAGKAGEELITPFVADVRACWAELRPRLEEIVR